MELMNLNEKIRKFITERDLTSTKFADEIGVPRPSISHILSDRNKPSLEIIQKMYKRYPELGLNWFLDEEEKMPENNSQSTDSQIITPKTRVLYTPREMNEKKIPEPSPVQANLGSLNLPVSSNNSIARIMVVFSDGSIQEFKPS